MSDLEISVLIMYFVWNVGAFLMIIFEYGDRISDGEMFHDGFKVKHLIWCLVSLPSVLFMLVLIVIFETLFWCHENFLGKGIIKKVLNYPLFKRKGD